MDQSIKLEHKKTTEFTAMGSHIVNDSENQQLLQEREDDEDAHELVSRTDTAVTIPVTVPGATQQLQADVFNNIDQKTEYFADKTYTYGKDAFKEQIVPADAPQINNRLQIKAANGGNKASVGTFGAKSRRDTGRTANTQKIAKARSLNTISANAGPGSSFNARKPARMMVNGKIKQQQSDVFKMYQQSQNVVVVNSSSPDPSTRQSKTVKNSHQQFNNSQRPGRGQASSPLSSNAQTVTNKLNHYQGQQQQPQVTKKEEASDNLTAKQENQTAQNDNDNDDTTKDHHQMLLQVSATDKTSQQLQEFQGGDDDGENNREEEEMIVVNSVTDGERAVSNNTNNTNNEQENNNNNNCADVNDVAELATSSSKAAAPADENNALAAASSHSQATGISQQRKRNDESAQNMVVIAANTDEAEAEESQAPLAEDVTLAHQMQQQEARRPQTRGAVGPSGCVSGGKGISGALPKGRILSQAFALSHDSYSTIKSNYNCKQRDGADFFTKRQNQRVDRLINRINNSTGKQSNPSPDQRQVVASSTSKTRSTSKYNSTRAIQNLNTIDCNGSNGNVNGNAATLVQQQEILARRAMALQQRQMIQSSTGSSKRPVTTHTTLSGGGQKYNQRRLQRNNHFNLLSQGLPTRTINSRHQRISPKHAAHHQNQQQNQTLQVVSGGGQHHGPGDFGVHVTYLRNAMSAHSSHPSMPARTANSNNRRQRCISSSAIAARNAARSNRQQNRRQIQHLQQFQTVNGPFLNPSLQTISIRTTAATNNNQMLNANNNAAIIGETSGNINFNDMTTGNSLDFQPGVNLDSQQQNQANNWQMLSSSIVQKSPNTTLHHFNTNPRRRLPYSTRHASFHSMSEANSFFRADIQPLHESKQKIEFFQLQKKLVTGELDSLQKQKQDLLHKSLKLFFRVHFMADKRAKLKAEAQELHQQQMALLPSGFTTGDDETNGFINVDDETGENVMVNVATSGEILSQDEEGERTTTAMMKQQQQQQMENDATPGGASTQIVIDQKNQNDVEADVDNIFTVRQPGTSEEDTTPPHDNKAHQQSEEHQKPATQKEISDQQQESEKDTSTQLQSQHQQQPVRQTIPLSQTNMNQESRVQGANKDGSETPLDEGENAHSQLLDTSEQYYAPPEHHQHSMVGADNRIAGAQYSNQQNTTVNPVTTNTDHQMADGQDSSNVVQDSPDGVGFHQVNEEDGDDMQQDQEDDNDGTQLMLMSEHEKLTFQVMQMRDLTQELREHLLRRNQVLYQLNSEVEVDQFNSQRTKLSNALKLISKMKSYEIKQKTRNDALLDSQRDAIFQLNAISQPKQSSTKSPKSSSKHHRKSPMPAFLAPSKGSPFMIKPQQSPNGNSRRKKSEVDKQAATMVFKVEYEQMEPADKLDYLKVQIQDAEVALREKTDRALQSQKAFDAIMENQRFFAVSQDKFANLAKKRREEIALRSVKEVNDLISQRKRLQIEAFRLTENFKTKVNSMAQSEVEDIFAKTMKRNQFKASSTLRLAKTFLQKHKVMTTWRAKDHMNALEEVDDENEAESPRNKKGNNHQAGAGGDNENKPKKKATKITEEENSSVDRSRDGRNF